MGAKEFGELVDTARSAKGWSLARVGVAVGVLPTGKVLNENQVKRILEGRRGLDRYIIERLIDELQLDPDEAWYATGLRPPWATVESYRELRKVSPPEPALAHATGGSDTPPAPSLRKARTPPRTEGRRRGNSCYSYRTGHPRRLRKRLLGPAHIGQRVAV
jgi:transcriptional regulator with XRE-family HTH domain